MSVSIEDFVKGIYQLQIDLQQKASSSNLAGRLGISHAAVTDMAKKLSAKGLIIYQKYKEIKLTGEGEKMALKVIRRHRLWELFLSKVLHMPMEEIHHEAEKLEHQTSDRLTQKLDEFLGHPSYDPHGDPIPGADGQMPEDETLLLSEAKTGNTYEIARIRHGSDELVRFFDGNNIKPGLPITVDQIFEPGNNVAVKINNKPFVLNELITKNIYLTPIS